MSSPRLFHCSISILTRRNSDGSTPAEQSKQILSVIPILPGQIFEERMPIPQSRLSRESTRTSRLQDLQALDDPSAAGVLRVPVAPPMNNNAKGNDLVDFGQDGAPVPVQAPAAQAAPVYPVAPVPVPGVTQGAPIYTTAPVPPPVTTQEAPVYPTAPVPPPAATQGVPVYPTPHAPVPATAQRASASPTPHVPLPADLLAAQVENGGRAQNQIEATLAETATGNNGKLGSQSPLLDFHKDLGQSLKRADSDTRSLDEFVDAEG